MKYLKKIKHLDLFRVKKNFNLAKNTSKAKNRFKLLPTDFVGSAIGGLLSVFLVVLVVSQSTSLMVRMHAGLDDNSKLHARSNHLQDGEDKIDVPNT
jgi:hypothetical protein